MKSFLAPPAAETTSPPPVETSSPSAAPSKSPSAIPSENLFPERASSQPHIRSRGEAKSVFISTYGCQMNVNDSERMYSLLEMQNYVQVDQPDLADLILINSCSVREKPVHKVRSEVGRYHKLKAKNPDLMIGVGGCVGQQEKGALIQKLPILDFVFGPDNIDELPRLISEVTADRAKAQAIGQTSQAKSYAHLHNSEPYHVETLVRNPGVSTFVNITKGCDNFCTFCVVPFTRGRLRSRPLKDLMNDVNRLCERGVKEVTLLGQNVNSYLSECGADFPDLLKALATETDITRIRYTTSHPKDFDDKLIMTMAEFKNKICDAVHLPVQSGNSRVLDAMNRGYTREEYLDKMRRIRAALPNGSLSTDIIVGFPGETEAEFLDTLSLLEEVPFEAIYAFTYSPRPFTKALKMVDDTPEEVKSERLARLIKRHQEIQWKLSERYHGELLEVLVEGDSWTRPGMMVGRSTTNRLVAFPATSDLIGKLVHVRIDSAAPHTLQGQIEIPQAVAAASFNLKIREGLGCQL